jgi:prenyltransferase beta subunit
MQRILLAGCCLVLAVCPVLAQTPDIQARVESQLYLTRLQQPDGGFVSAAGEDKSSLRATSAAVRAIKYLGGKTPNADRCREFIKSCHDKNTGGFADQPGGQPNVATTAVGLMALVELKIPTEPYEAKAIKYLGMNSKSFEDIRIAVAGLEAVGKQAQENDTWMKQVVAMRNPDGTFGKGDAAARDTGGAVVAMLRMGAKAEDREAILKVLTAGQRPGGGYGKAGVETGDLETSYRVMRAYHMLKTQPLEARSVRAFVARCRNADGGYGVSPGQKSSVSATYFAAIILHWMDEK